LLSKHPAFTLSTPLCFVVTGVTVLLSWLLLQSRGRCFPSKGTLGRFDPVLIPDAHRCNKQG
jgi:hypothetical protein